MLPVDRRFFINGDRSLIANIASLLACGLLAGLVVAGAAFPAAAIGGLAAKSGADTFDKLPTDLKVLPAPQMSYVYASDGKTLLAYLYDENRLDVKAEDVAPVMLQAIVASEDSRFYKHKGVDMKGVARAFVANQQGMSKQGASTLTMQYVRNVTQYTARTPQQVIDATDDTPGRKLREMKLAIALEKKFTKPEILLRYLNIAAFGHQAYGISAASQVYFGKPPSQLTLAEASLLAGLVQAPTAYDPADKDKRPAALARRNYVLAQMVKLGSITQAQADEAAKTEPTIVGKRTPEGCNEVQHPELNAGFFCDYLKRWWNSNPAFGSDAYDRENRLRSQGYKIISSLDISTQTGAMNAVTKRTKNLAQSDGMMVAAVEPGTGRVQALAVNRKFSNDQGQNGQSTNPHKKGQKGNYPNTTVPLITGGGDINGYQQGSEFKVFTIVAALEQGIPLDYTIDTVSPYKTKYRAGVGEPAACSDGSGFYCVKNADANFQKGSHNMWTAFGRSVNTYFLPLQEAAGADKAVDVAKRLGLTFRGNDAKFVEAAAHNGAGSFTLGVTTQTPLEMANAYATLAAEGTYCKPTPVVQILDAAGQKVPGSDPDCNKVVSEDVARGAMDAGRCPVAQKTAYDKCSNDDTTANSEVQGIVRNLVVSGKSGSTDDHKSTNMVMTTRQLAVAGTLTDPDNPQTSKQYTHNEVDPAVGETLRAGMAGKPNQDFGKPSQAIAFGNQVSIPDVHCKTPEAARDILRDAGFKSTVAEGQIPGDCPAGTVQSTRPSGKTISGGQVTLVISSGGGGAPGGPGGPPGGFPPGLPPPGAGGGGGNVRPPGR